MRCLYIILLICILAFSSLITGQIPSNGPTYQLVKNDIVSCDESKETVQNKKIYDFLSELSTSDEAPSGTIQIPVVVHIIHEAGVENISDTQVASAISYLNDGFRGTSTGVNMHIEFCLANQAPDGNPTTGINRVDSYLTEITMENDDASLKRLSCWPSSNYVNIWVVKSIVSNISGPAIAAYSTRPLSHGTSVDGIVVEAGVFGASEELSKIVTHTFGHFLGLYHTFENGCKNDNCMLDGDRVCDTPPDATSQFVNNLSGINSCISDDDDLSSNNPFRPTGFGGGGDRPDFISNYMDHNYLSCLNTFTEGQKDRINAVLQTIRSSLLVSNGIKNRCPFTLDAAYTVPSADIPIGSTVMFNNVSTPDTGLAYEWYVNNTFFSNAKSPVYTFKDAGCFNVMLIIKGDSPECIDKHVKSFKVSCPIKANFQPDTTPGRTGVRIHFKNTSTGQFQLSRWIVDNTEIEQSTDFDYTFTRAGTHSISLIVSSNTCQSRKDLTCEIGGYSQISKRAQTWYFGNGGGISFANNAVVPLTNSPSFTNEGSGSISDESGNFLFSAIPIDGGTANFLTVIRDRNHNIMPNGTGIAGGTSSAQICIVPHPGNPKLYYIFSASERASGGLYVSVVDMSYNNGLGDVTLKNIQLQEIATEKIAACAHANGRDFWVVTHPWNSGDFYAYLINQDGFIKKPVISSAGSVLSGNESGACGVMKIAPDGKYLALTAQYNPDSYTEVFDFNNRSGTVSRFVKLNNLPQAYGLEFSADGSKLYVSCGWNSQAGSGIYQFNLAKSNALDVAASRYCVYPASCYGQLQLGPDQRIYFSRVLERYLGVIQSPDIAGEGCNYDHRGVTLDSNKRCYFGLPSFVSSFVVLVKSRIDGPKEVSPNAKEVSYKLTPAIPRETPVQWSINGAGSISKQTSDAATVSFKSSGNARMIAKINVSGSMVYDTLYITIRKPSVDLGSDLILCSGGSILLDAGYGFESYRWQDGSTSQTFRASEPGIYSVQVISAGGDIASDSVTIKSTGTLDLGPDRIVCPGSTIILDAGQGFLNYRWQDGSTNQTFTAFQPENKNATTYRYAVTATDLCGKDVSDEVLVTFDIPRAHAGPDVIVCRSEPAVLRGYGNGKCKWFDAQGNQTGVSNEITVAPTASTFYVLSVEANGCYGYDTVKVTITSDCPECRVKASQDIIIPAGQPVTLNVSTNGHCSRSNCSNKPAPVNCQSGYTGTLQGTVHTDINDGQVIGVLSETLCTGSVNVQGGTLIICGKADLSSLTLQKGKIIVTGELTVPDLTINGTLENYGTIRISHDCTVSAPGVMNNYGILSITGSLSSSSRTSNFSTLNIGRDLNQNSSDIFTNECTMTIGNELQIHGTLINKGTITSNGTATCNAGSQFIADDGSLLSVKNIRINSQIQGGSAGSSSIQISENTFISSDAKISGHIDICDAGGIEIQSGIIANTVTTDCRSTPDGHGGRASFVWSDNQGKIVGTGKQLTITPNETSVYTITVTDTDGRKTSDQVTVTVKQ